LEFVHERSTTPLLDAIAAVVASPLDAAEKLTSILRIWREYLVTHQAIFEFLINDQAAKRHLESTEQTARDAGIRHIVTILQQGIDDGVFRPVDTEAVAEMMQSAAIGMVEREFALGRLRPVDGAVETISGIFLKGLSAGAGRRES
jgi:hypothetical protein